MYLKIKRLTELGLNLSQIDRHLDISRNTVYKYRNSEPDKLEKIITQWGKREKKLDYFCKEILS
ncbi:hypothetical protein [Thermosyntropha sp.]|uniref:hypothetical protein n=1 Tax=Thermosyntropha sp. TaxID=2740820 RepID=UPI0025CD7CA7|nr:hypothetical protein [Thermosyntropha sp.]MBO8159706.1 integrase [Thermosyntropha sp.]